MARDFDGVDDTITCGNATPINNLASFTYSAWIRPDTIGEGGVGRIIDKFEKMIYLAATNAVGSFLNRATVDSEIQSANNTITMGVWQFVAATFNGTTLRLFHGPAGSVPSDLGLTDGGSGAAVSDNTRVLTIGNNSGGTGATFDGRIAYVRVHNAALTANELTGVMYNRPVRQDALVGFWPLIGSSPEPDWSGNVANGTVTGALVADGPPVPPPWLGDEEFLAWVAASSGVSGTIAAALADATSAISGTTTVTGSIGATLANTASAITGTTTVLGTMAALLVNATSAITGTTTVTGAIAAVLQACTSVINATTTVLGSLAVTLANAVSAITGDAGAPPPATGNVLWWFRRRGRRS